MDTEKTSDFQSIRDRFQSGGRANTLPAYTKEREEELLPTSRICNVRCNPALQGVISVLENQTKPAIVSKPELPAKPNGSSFSLNIDMRKRGKTFYVSDSKRTESDGVCASSPQVYRHSMPNFADPPPPEIYQDVDSVLPPPAAITNIIKFSPPPPIAPKPMIKIINVPKDEWTEKVPPLKPLPPAESLGSPPSKPPRPLNVDLSTFFTGSLQQNGVSYKPVVLESTETEYEEPPSLAPMSEDVYDETYSPAESDANAYAVSDDVEYDAPDAVNPVPEAVRPATEVISPYESEGMACYEEILKVRESMYSSNFYDTEEANPVRSPETADGYTHKVSVDDDLSYSSTVSSSNKSSASEGYYSANFDTSTGLLGQKESKSKEVKMGKDEQVLRKKYKITGQEKMLYSSKIMEDFKHEKNALTVKKGDKVEVIQMNDCPPGKWLSRDVRGKYGFVPVASLQISDEIQALCGQNIFQIPADKDLYADIEVRRRDSGVNADTCRGSDSYSGNSDEHYDDISSTGQSFSSSGGKGKGFVQLFKKNKSKEDQAYSPVIPNLNRTTSHDSDEHYIYDLTDEHEREKEEKSPGWRGIFQKNKEQKVFERKFFGPTTGVKKFAKEEKIFREKFKYTGEINVINTATINDLAPLSPKDKLDLAVKPGEIVEVIDVTNEDQIICRNFAGKYGYLRIDCLNFKMEDHE
ncbi:FYN-binding protein 2 isoform X1 [Ranitomeya imitator]|uniref:FYN-binding protein 2 isoform X1 n=1 Tax=Ranitomeya imitator TaxID=111125 RepID=UPI0037E92FDE